MEEYKLAAAWSGITGAIACDASSIGSAPHALLADA